MYKTNNIVLLTILLIFSMSVNSSIANVDSTGDLPEDVTKPMGRMEVSLPTWWPQAYGLFCADNLSLCYYVPPKKTALFSLPKIPKPRIDRMTLGIPTLPPMAHSMFCIQHPKDCAVRKIAFRGGPIGLTPERLRDLKEVNAKVNRSIRPQRNTMGWAGEKWVLNPRSGDCNDYAVSKRHELLARGWPSHTLLLAEVVTSWGEHHLILVVRTEKGDLVLDNMSANIRPWSKVPYEWVRVQSPRNPKFWAKLRTPDV